MKRAARLSTVLGVALLCVVACFSKPGDPHFQAPNDGGIDAKVFMDAKVFEDAPDAKVFEDAPDAKVFLDAPGTGCSVATDDFNNTALAACGNWGVPNTVAGTLYSRSSGALLLNAQMGKNAFCSTVDPFHFVNGVTIKLQSVANAGDTYVQVRFSNGQTAKMTIQPGSMPNPSLYMSCNGGPGTSLGNTAPALYMKLSADASFQFITVSFSGTNGNFTASPLSCGITAPSDDLVNVDIGVTGGSGTGSAYFDDFNTANCPPPP